MSTEDIAHILLRFSGGARGSCVVSQVSAGRKNALRFEIDGSTARWPGTRSATRSSGSATATSRTRRCSGTRR